VLWGLGERVSEFERAVKYLKDALAAYRAALEVRTREQLPDDWAETQQNVGVVLDSLSRSVSGEDSINYLKQALMAYRGALEVRTRERLPQAWASTQNNRGLVLQRLGNQVSRPNGIKYLQDAAGAYRAALEVYTREQLPQDWAKAQNNLGIVLRSLSGRVSEVESTAYLNQAVAAHRAALEVFTRETLPQGWAYTQVNLASAYFHLHSWSDSEEAYQNVLILYPDDKQTQANLAEVRFILGRFLESRELINRLLTTPDAPVRYKTATRAIEIASLIADSKDSEVAIKIDALIAEVAGQPPGFIVTWNFDDLRHSIDQNQRFSPYRAWLGQLFDALAGKDRDMMLKALQDVRAKLCEKR
jgi:tetratricopeptide (TPR) repeat protein